VEQLSSLQWRETARIHLFDMPSVRILEQGRAHLVVRREPLYRASNRGSELAFRLQTTSQTSENYHKLIILFANEENSPQIL
jgi:hypothetical protein